MAAPGAVEVKVIVWVSLLTVKVCWTWGAGVVVGVAGLVGVDDAGAAPDEGDDRAVVPPRCRAEVEPELKATVRPERRRGRRGVGGAAHRGRGGAVEVKVIVWVPLLTVKVCWTWVAA